MLLLSLSSYNRRVPGVECNRSTLSGACQAVRAGRHNDRSVAGSEGSSALRAGTFRNASNWRSRGNVLGHFRPEILRAATHFAAGWL